MRNVNAGESVGYSRKTILEKDSVIAAIPIGYADGFPRSLTNKAQAIIKGKIYNQVGTVTMDRIMFDVGNDNINVNDEVILIGKNSKNSYELNNIQSAFSAVDHFFSKRRIYSNLTGSSKGEIVRIFYRKNIFIRS